MDDLADLVSFIRARLDEDEAAAKAAVDSSRRAKCSTWAAQPDGNSYVVGDESGHFAFCLVGGEGVMQHVTRHDPARVLREVEAKRAILTAYACADGHSPRDRDRGRWDSLDAAARHLAAIWSDHPDYRPEWKP